MSLTQSRKISSVRNTATGFKARVFQVPNGHLIALYTPSGERIPYCDRRVLTYERAREIVLDVLNV